MLSSQTGSPAASGDLADRRRSSVLARTCPSSATVTRSRSPAGPRRARVRRPHQRAAPAASSAIVPCRTRTPLAMMTTSSTVCSTSGSRWLETRTVLPWPREVPQEAAQPADALGVEPVGRFVQDQHPRVAEQRGGQAEPLPHAEREAAGPAAGERGEADEREQLVDAASGDAGGRREHPQVVAPGPPGWKLVASSAAPTARAARAGRGSCARRSWRVPAVGVTSPSSIRRVVVLPAPFGPRKPVIRPGSTAKLRSSTARRRRTAWSAPRPRCVLRSCADRPRPGPATSVMRRTGPHRRPAADGDPDHRRGSAASRRTSALLTL